MATTHTLRIKSDIRSVTNELTDVLTSAAPKLFSGSDVSIEVGVFEGTDVLDISNFSTVTFEIKKLSAGGPPPSGQAYLVQKSISSFDNTLDSSSWTAVTKQHFTVTLTDIDTGGLKEGIKWMSAYVTTDSGTKITLFAGKLTVVEDGTGDSSGSDTETSALTSAGDLITHNGTTGLRKAAGSTGTFLKVDTNDPDGDNTNLTWATPAGGGDISGPGSSTDNAVVTFSGTSGTVVQHQSTTIDDSGNLDVDGNITVSGTVDGRDLATDGTKLDGIEASADVTDEANVKSALDGATITSATVATGDKILVQDVDDSDNLKTVTAQSIADLAGGAVDSVNSQTGTVVLDADDIDDTSTTHKFATAAQLSKLDGVESNATADQTGAEIKTAYEAEANTNAFTDAEQTKLSGIETSADVTDEANVTSALDGATLTAVTVATGDKVLVQDASDSDNLKTVTAQSIADLAAGGGGGDLELISTDTISTAVSSVDISGLDSSSYDSYMFVIQGLSIATDNAIVYISFSTDNGSTFTVDLSGAHRTMGSGTVSNAFSALDNANLSASATVTMSNGTNSILDGTLWVYHPANTSNWKGFQYSGHFSDDGANSHFQGYTAGVAKTTSAITDIRFHASSGNLDGGKIHMYGLKNS